MNIAVLNSNLAPGGKSAHLVEALTERLEKEGHDPMPYHVGDLGLPACDGTTCYADEKTIDLTAKLADADAIILVSPIYNYDLNASAKNLIELTGDSWKGKAVGLVCQAGGEKSYLAPLSFMNSLSIDYRCLVSPRFVYVVRSEFAEDNTLVEGSPVHARLDLLAKELPILADAAGRISELSLS